MNYRDIHSNSVYQSQASEPTAKHKTPVKLWFNHSLDMHICQDSIMENPQDILFNYYLC